MIANPVSVKLAYLGHSQLLDSACGQTMQLEPNLAREAVSFDAPLLRPLRFREAISSLHEVVVSDLRFKKKDKTAYQAWKQDQTRRQQTIRQQALKEATAQALAQQAIPVPGDLLKAFEQSRKQYWDARLKYSDYLYRHDQELWRMLVPCDPVITVADDVLLFECFSGDESSYGCLTVDRADGLGKSDNTRLGTTNVDYSWPLYHNFQALRSYRQTRFCLDPAGFEVATSGQEDYHEEKIDLPPGWLQGFMQVTSAMTLPANKITLSRSAVYSILAYLRRHRAWKSPRAIRFELLPGKAIKIVLEPWEIAIVDYGSRYDGPGIEPIRVWGGKRLLTLARTLPLADRYDVHLLGTGLPHFWVAQMGEMKLTVGLSGWTTNDWTRSAALDLVAPYRPPEPSLLAATIHLLRVQLRATFAEIQALANGDAPDAHGVLRHLAQTGQAIFDLTANVYRWRQVLPMALGEAEMGPPHPELIGLHSLLDRAKIQVESAEELANGSRLIQAKIAACPTEILMDAEGRIKRGKCVCGYYRQFGLKNGPCRHMMAVRWLVLQQVEL